jgi:hypothetical protein
MNLEKISRVITLATELITRAEHAETEAGADGFFHLRHRGHRSPAPHQHGTDEGARRPAEARVMEPWAWLRLLTFAPICGALLPIVCLTACTESYIRLLSTPPAWLRRPG